MENNTYIVTKRKPGNVGGFEKLSTRNIEAEAERLARGHDGTINGKPAGSTRVWSQKEYDDWHQAEIMPYYR